VDHSTTSPAEPDDQLPAATALAAVAALSDPLRRQMYGFTRRARRPITREEAASAVGISRKLAAFHLDKLVEVGLLQARYEPAGGIRKVGRTPKVYQPTNTELHISIPARDHTLLSGILIDAVLTPGQDRASFEAALQIAQHRGAELGSTERNRTRPGRLGTERALTLAATVLARYGFEPDRTTPTLLRLRNCPFRLQASTAPQLVCGITHAFITGLLDALQANTLTAVLAPRVGECCVELAAR
jgi:predicted ArsR family transcriptional regulator